MHKQMAKSTDVENMPGDLIRKTSMRTLFSRKNTNQNIRQDDDGSVHSAENSPVLKSKTLPQASLPSALTLSPPVSLSTPPRPPPRPSPPLGPNPKKSAAPPAGDHPVAALAEGLVAALKATLQWKEQELGIDTAAEILYIIGSVLMLGTVVSKFTGKLHELDGLTLMQSFMTRCSGAPALLGKALFPLSVLSHKPNVLSAAQPSFAGELARIAAKNTEHLGLMQNILSVVDTVLGSANNTAHQVQFCLAGGVRLLEALMQRFENSVELVQKRLQLLSAERRARVRPLRPLAASEPYVSRSSTPVPFQLRQRSGSTDESEQWFTDVASVLSGEDWFGRFDAAAWEALVEQFQDLETLVTHTLSSLAHVDRESYRSFADSDVTQLALGLAAAHPHNLTLQQNLLLFQKKLLSSVAGAAEHLVAKLQNQDQQDDSSTQTELGQLLAFVEAQMGGTVEALVRASRVAQERVHLQLAFLAALWSLHRLLVAMEKADVGSPR